MEEVIYLESYVKIILNEPFNKVLSKRIDNEFNGFHEKNILALAEEFDIDIYTNDGQYRTFCEVASNGHIAVSSEERKIVYLPEAISKYQAKYILDNLDKDIEDMLSGEVYFTKVGFEDPYSDIHVLNGFNKIENINDRKKYFLKELNIKDKKKERRY